MLYKVAQQLSGNVIVLYLDDSTAKAYLCYVVVAASLFLSRLACYIFNLNNKHGITLLQHTYILISMWKLAIYDGENWS